MQRDLFFLTVSWNVGRCVTFKSTAAQNLKFIPQAAGLFKRRSPETQKLTELVSVIGVFLLFFGT